MPADASRTTRWLLTRATAAACLVTAIGCDAPAVSDTFDLDLAADGAPARVGASWRVAELGRLAVDWRIENPSTAEAAYELHAQAQTSGSQLDSACDAIERRVVRIESTPGATDRDTAPPDGITLTSIRELDQAFLVGTSSEVVTWLELRIGEDSRYRVATSAVTALHVLPNNSETPLTPVSATAGAETGCPGVGSAQVFDLFSGTYLVRLPSGPEGTVRLLIEEECQAARVVGRTCPGTFGPTRIVPVGPLAGGASLTGRLGSDQLGVGDQISLELRCAAPADRCAGRVHVAIINEALECRNDEACSGSRSCSDDGYCLLDDAEGCSASSTRSSLPAALGVAILLALTAGRRRARRALRAAPVLLLLTLGAPATSAAAGPGGQVYTELGISSLTYTGALGRLTSPGVGLELAQGLQLGVIGGRISIGTSYYLTRQEAPPNEHLLQTFQVAVGPRVGHLFAPVRVLGSVEYVTTTFVTNAATAATGPRTLGHGLGASVAVRFEGLLPVYAEVRLGGDAIFGLRVPAIRLGITLTIGIAGAI